MSGFSQHADSEARLLPGDLQLVQLQRPGAGLVAARLWIRGGSSRDPQGARGAMQLLAGSMTRGAGHLDAHALAEWVESRGAALRSEASEDALVISLKCASDDARDLVPLLLQMATQPRLEDDQVHLERDLNLQSLQRQQEDPFQVAYDLLRQQLYGKGPYGHDPLGQEPDLQQLDAPKLKPLAAQLGDQGALLVLCGDLDASLSGLLEAALVQCPWRTRPPSWSAGPCEEAGAVLGHRRMDTEQLVVMVGAATVPLGHPDSVALRLLQAHLGLGMSSRLFVQLREEHGLAYDVGVHMPARCGATPFVWHLSTSADRAGEACSCVQDEWSRMLQRPLTHEELQMARAKFRGQDALGRQTCSQVADRTSLVLGSGLPGSYVQDCLDQAEQLQPEDLLEAARRWLPNPRISLCGPQQGIDAAELVVGQSG
jgi:zinc protease